MTQPQAKPMPPVPTPPTTAPHQDLIVDEVIPPTPDTDTAATPVDRAADATARTSGIIDNSPSLVLPVYVWAGTSIGGQNVVQCSLCGAMLRDSYDNDHTTFHRQVNALLQYTGVQP